MTPRRFMNELTGSPLALVFAERADNLLLMELAALHRPPSCWAALAHAQIRWPEIRGADQPWLGSCRKRAPPCRKSGLSPGGSSPAYEHASSSFPPRFDTVRLRPPWGRFSDVTLEGGLHIPGGSMTISIVNHSNGQVTDEDLQKAVRAINRQIQEDFAPYWGMSAVLRLEGRSAEKPETVAG